MPRAHCSIQPAGQSVRCRPFIYAHFAIHWADLAARLVIGSILLSPDWYSGGAPLLLPLFRDIVAFTAPGFSSSVCLCFICPAQPANCPVWRLVLWSCRGGRRDSWPSASCFSCHFRIFLRFEPTHFSAPPTFISISTYSQFPIFTSACSMSHQIEIHQWYFYNSI